MESFTQPVAHERDLNSLSLLTVSVVLATVTMTFGALITVFVVRSQGRIWWGNLHVPNVLWATTAVLITSSVLLEAARRKLRSNDQRGFFRLTLWTTILGGFFLAGQIDAWFVILHSGVVLAHNAHSWFVFLFTGLHGLHIALGLAGLIYLLVRTHEPASGPKYQMTTRVVTNGVVVFWHYLDFIWLVLFVLLLALRG